jgi:hypothetical protein
MLSLGVLLSTLTAAASPAAPAARAASTYDEAACADGEADPPAPAADDDNCSEPPAVAVVPAVIDCNDARASLWVAEMIGSCDMPRPSAPTAAVGRARDLPDAQRICDGIRCRHESLPLRAGARNLDDSPPWVATRVPLRHFLVESRLVVTTRLGRSQAYRAPLERPPRSTSSIA